MKALADIPHDYRAFEECFLYDHVGESLEERFFSAYVKGNVALVIREMSDAKKEYVNLLKMNKHYERFWELNPADQKAIYKDSFFHSLQWLDLPSFRPFISRHHCFCSQEKRLEVCKANGWDKLFSDAKKNIWVGENLFVKNDEGQAVYVFTCQKINAGKRYCLTFSKYKKWYKKEHARLDKKIREKLAFFRANASWHQDLFYKNCA